MEATSPLTSCAPAPSVVTSVPSVSWGGADMKGSHLAPQRQLGHSQINKQTLNAFPMPYAIATWQLMASVLCGTVLWLTKTIPRPRITGDFAKALLPVALFHTVVRRCSLAFYNRAYSV